MAKQLYLKPFARICLVFLWCVASPAWAETVRLEFDRSNPQASYAAERLSAALREQKHEVAQTGQSGALVVSLSLDADRLRPEAFAIAPGNRSLAISGGDGRGIVYGALTVVERLRNGAALQAIGRDSASPALAFRAIKFNLPWDSYRSSSGMDQHYDTVRDAKFWRAFLDMMANNRFNALTLWNLHPFPYMIRAKNFPEASRFSEAELAEWRKLYQAIFRMAKERGIDTYVVNWNILVSPEFAKAHSLKGGNHYPNFKGDAETSEIVKRYTRESVTQMLEEYPDLTGFGFTLAEQMGGMTPVERQNWIEESIIAGMKAAKRPTKMIFRAPLSADLGQGGSTSVATEKMTRKAIEGLGNSFAGPIWMEIKFNWSHAHSTPRLIKTHGGPLNDVYFNPPPKNYKITWMARNEDFFALRWGVPSFVREHIRLNGQQDYVGGYFVGSETYIPAKDYFTALSAPVNWTYAFERQWLFYKLWGRLLYDPTTPDSVFEAEFVRRYGSRARPLLKAYALASATQLKFASSIDFTWDSTLYGEGMMVMGRERMQPISVERLIQQKPLLPDWISVKDFVAKQAAGEQVAPGTMTPLLLANQLQADCTRALALVRTIDTSRNASLLYEVADVRIWANLGLYYAEKLRGAVELQLYRTLGRQADKDAAVRHLEKSLGYWDAVIAISRPIYRDMPLVHYNPPDNRRNDDNLFHWALVRPAIAKDVDVARSATFARAP
jgi:hypothetical protein